MTEEQRWNRISELFDRLIAGEAMDSVLSSVADAEIRLATKNLWDHHQQAAIEDFLGESVEFEVAPVFAVGQVLLNRFAIKEMLGRGGMGEVYLAYDREVDEHIALKTVARLLAQTPAIRRRIAAEVQNARKINNPHVCRIYDLFEDGDTVFFTMEHVKGKLLTDYLEEPDEGFRPRLLLWQLAEALYEGHNRKVIHGDFKPSNVMVVPGNPPRPVIMDFGLARAVDQAGVGTPPGLSVLGGSLEFMAPELKQRQAPTIASDIYAYGKVALQVLPDERIFRSCIAAEVDRRPTDLEPVLRRLRPQSSRRSLVIGGAIAACTVIGYRAATAFIRGPEPPAMPMVLPSGARLLVNGFATRNQRTGARTVRGLLLTALQQSPRVRIIADQDLLPLMKRMGATLPLRGEALQKVLRSMRASYWMEADLDQRGGRYSLRAQVFRAADGQSVSDTAFLDLPGIGKLAGGVSEWIRKMAGESPESLLLNSSDVPSYTSQSPEALEKYYEAMEYFASAKIDLAIPLLQDAIRFDGNFAQAHASLGMMYNPQGRFDEAFKEVELGMQLAGSLPEREQVRIEASYRLLCTDPIGMVDTARKNAVYYPDESRFQRVLANALCLAGRADEGVPFGRKALELNPESPFLHADLVNCLAEAGKSEEAEQEFNAMRTKGLVDSRLNTCGGYSYLGLGHYQESLRCFEQAGNDDDSIIDQQRPRIMSGHVESAIPPLLELKAGSKAVARVHSANEFLCGSYYVTDQSIQAASYVKDMVGLPPYPSLARKLACTAFWAGRLGDAGSLTQAHGTLSAVATRWPNGYTTGAEKYARGLLAWKSNSLDEAQSLLLEASGSAFNLWALFDLADLFALRSNLQAADDYWQRIEVRRGTILQRWFPGLLVIAWAHRARAAHARGDKQTALVNARKVIRHWGKTLPHVQLVQLAQGIVAASS